MSEIERKYQELVRALEERQSRPEMAPSDAWQLGYEGKPFPENHGPHTQSFWRLGETMRSRNDSQPTRM